jgi:quercetin dioxygenase-like cupin family protein
LPAQVTRWQAAQQPTPEKLLAELQQTRRSYATWSNGPGDEYAVHTHAYRKHLVCLSGSITFTLPVRGDAIELAPGDALDLPAGTAHSAKVGPKGVHCAVAHLFGE